MDYDGMLNDVFQMRETAKLILREWERYQWFLHLETRQHLQTFVHDCTYFMRRLHNDGKTQKVVFD